MPKIDTRMVYTIELTDQEFRLVTMGLANMLQDAEDATDALQLNTKLCRQRVLMVEQARQVADRALAGATALQNPSIPPYKAKG